MNVKELKKKAKELKIKGYSKMKKAELEQAIKAATPKKTLVMDASKKQEEEPMPVAGAKKEEAPKKKQELEITANERKVLQLGIIKANLELGLKKILMSAAKALTYTKQITYYGCEMDCYKCSNTGWLDYTPDEGRCYWCNKEGRRFKGDEQSQVVVEQHELLTWMRYMRKYGDMLKSNGDLIKKHFDSWPYSELLLKKAKNCSKIVTEEHNRLRDILVAEKERQAKADQQ